MKVLFVYKYLTLGGCEAVLRARLDGLAKFGIEARAWFIHEAGGRTLFSGMEDRIQVGGIPELAREIRHNPPDILSTLDTEEIFPLFRQGDATCRLVVEVHSSYLDNIEYLRETSRLAIAAFLVPSECQARLVRERVGPGQSIRVAPNPLRTAFLAAPAPPVAQPDRPIVAWIGRLDDFKNWREFIEIGSRLAAMESPAALWIAGRPPDAQTGQKLIEHAKMKGVLGRLRWFRGLPHECVPAMLDAVRDSGGVLASTSRGESFGLTVAEGMARECAVVVPHLGPFPEYVRDGESGVFFKPGDALHAAREIQSLLADESRRRRLGSRAREIVLARHAPEPALRVLAATLQEALAGRACRPPRSSRVHPRNPLGHASPEEF